jgi:hypothetical protein
MPTALRHAVVLRCASAAERRDAQSVMLDQIRRAIEQIFIGLLKHPDTKRPIHRSPVQPK